MPSLRPFVGQERSDVAISFRFSDDRIFGFEIAALRKTQ